MMLTVFREMDEVFSERFLKHFVFRGRRAECHLEATEKRQAVNHVEGEAAWIREPGGWIGCFGWGEGHQVVVHRAL